jgi:carbonic anhydrase
VTATRSFPNLGTQQSPVDLVDPFAADLRVSIGWKSLQLTPGTDDFTPTRKLAAAPGEPNGVLRVDGQRYVPIDLHWHFPSEHHVSGQKFRAEVHIVHIHKDDLHLTQRSKSSVLDWARLAVLGVFIKAGRLPYAPMGLSGKKTVTVDRADLIPADSKAIRYSGSLTTPPYSENVTFIIFDTPLTATREQLAPGKGNPNARALQDVNRRCCLIGDVQQR